jgi:hypothetical protein
MRLAIRNLVPDYLVFAREARRRRSDSLRRLWDDLYASRHPDVFGAYFEAGKPTDFDTTIERVASASDRFAERVGLLSAAAAELAPRVVDLFDAELDELSYVILVGLDQSDGWVQDLDRTPTAFFAVERFREPPWERAHVAHETTHLVHLAIQSEPWDDTVIGLRLILEGIALASTHRLLPTLPEWTHFNRDPAEIDVLLQAYAQAAPHASRSLRELAQSRDAEQLARFFYPDSWRTARDLPERVGYFLGWRAVELLCERVPLAELARLNPKDALAQAESALAALSAR